MRNLRSLHPDHVRTLDTEGLRAHFHVPDLFQDGALNMTYSHEDRMILLGAVPADAPLGLPEDVDRITGTPAMLARREMGVINIGAAGTITIDGTAHAIGPREALYIGAGTETVSFASDDPANPARLYANSAPAHRTLPAKKITRDAASPVHLGDRATSNERTIYRYLHPDVVETCQLLMGMTELGAGSNWNTFPPHLHNRRCETYLYFAMDPEAVVFHMMGEPDQTRHVIMRNEEAVISPPWSIHAGCGTGDYAFIWTMAGENQTFEDMDMIDPKALA